MNYLSEDGLKTLISKIKAYVKEKMPTKTSQLTNDSGYITTAYANDIKWGGSSIANDVSPIGMALADELRANRFAFINPDAVTVEYSRDSGATWSDYGKSDADKQQLFTNSYSHTYIGGTTLNSGASLDNQTRITLTLTTQQKRYLYTRLYKILIFFNRMGHSCEMKLEARKGKNYLNNTDEWMTIGTYGIMGWSGWNDIALNLQAGGSFDQTEQVWQIRFTFYYTQINSNYKERNSDIEAIFGYGSPCWFPASTMSETGNLYSYDINRNVQFPAVVTATNFIGKVNGYTVEKSVPSDAKFTDTTYDLTPYAKTSEVDIKISTKQDKLVKTTVTLGGSWTEDTNLDYYYQNIPIAGITKNTVAVLDVATEGRNSWWIGVWNADWQKIIGAETYDGGIKFIASEPFERNDVVVQVIGIN